MKKLYKVLAFLFIALTLVACGKKDNSENTTATGDEVKPASGDVIIKIGHVEPESRSTHKALVNFKNNVEEKSNGKIGIEIYPNGSLGGDVQMTESVAMGTLQSTLPSTSVLTTYSEEFGILDMPYLFLNSESAFKALDGEVGEYFNKKLEEQREMELVDNEKAIKDLETEGKLITNVLDDNQKVEFREAVQPMYDKYQKQFGQELFELCEKYNK